MNRHCSGYTIRCPKLVGRPWGPDGAYDADDQACEASVWVSLDGEAGAAWIEEYVPDCTHEWDELTPSQQDQATRDAVQESIDKAMDQAEATYDTHEERDLARGDG